MAIGERIGPSTVVGEGDSWMTERRKGVTATAVVTLLGRNPFRSDAALDAYREIVDGAIDVAGEAAEWGNHLEPIVVSQVGAITGRIFRRYGQSVLARDDVPHHRASPDAFCFDAECLLEAKTAVSTASHGYGEPYSDEVPEKVRIQVQWGMYVTGAKWTDVGVGWTDRRTTDYFHVPRDDEAIARLIDVVDDFWFEHVVPRVPPTPMKYAGAVHWPERLRYGRPKWRQAFTELADYYRRALLMQIEACSDDDQRAQARLALLRHDAVAGFFVNNSRGQAPANDGVGK